MAVCYHSSGSVASANCGVAKSSPLVCHQDGKTEYKSVTVAEDSTAEEFMDFYLDDHTRTKWVGVPASQ